jgi:hypothetical protein
VLLGILFLGIRIPRCQSAPLPRISTPPNGILSPTARSQLKPGSRPAAQLSRGHPRLEPDTYPP